ncbi:MAG: protein kinase domain-containing protein [Chloroflexota bacterium]
MDVGVVINHYEVVEHIGRGGMADVWSARDTKLNRMVAIKTIAHGLSEDADPVGMFKQEAQTIAQMEHPHILPIYDFGEFEGQLYIVMRYVAGGSLEDLLRRGPVPLTEALRMGQSIAQALDYAHSSKIVHLDLKPPNVLLDSHQSPYMADFGLATVLDPEGKASNPGSGTLLYMAPEQLTSDMIDYRADLYSFAIVMFHMLTGELPFEGGTPLALKQMQFHEELPELIELNPTLPAQFTAVLRRATALEPEDRHGSLMEIVEELQAIHMDSTGVGMGLAMDLASVEDDGYGEEDLYAQYAGLDAEILEAVDIYSRARHNWAGGNGRFLLGVTNFMVMNGYYMQADQYGLAVDNAGRQMLLRGALEYDKHIDFWWSQLDDDNRRWVCLHALRSGNAPARVRALYRLETLPDAEKPQIPKLVAQMLQVETNEEARLAALQVLSTRYKLMRLAPEYDVQTQYRGRLLTTLTRIGLNVAEPAEWREVVYTPEIDLLIAEIALDYGMPRVAEYAARVIGRMRSVAAVRRIAVAQREGERGAMRALALVRDEAPSLPPVVSSIGRVYAWSTNTIRRLFDRPLALILRFVLALVGGWLAMGLHIWSTFRSQAIFAPQRWINTLAVGLLFGLFIAVLVLVVDEFSRRLRGFWPWWVRLLVSASFGFWWATLIWAQFTWAYMQLPISWDVMRFGGAGLMLGFVLSAMFRLRSYIAIPLTALLTYIPINIAFFVGWRYQSVGPFEYGFEGFPQLDYAILYYGDLLEDGTWAKLEQIYTVAIPFVVILALGAYLPLLLADLRAAFRWISARFKREITIEEEVIPVPTPGLAGALLRPNRDAADLQTELDVYVPGAVVGSDEPEEEVVPSEVYTELDVSHGIARQQEAYIPEKPPVINLNTELDVSQGRERPPVKPDIETPDEEDEETTSSYRSKRVNFGTGIRIEPNEPRTERDVNQGLRKQRDEEDTE